MVTYLISVAWLIAFLIAIILTVGFGSRVIGKVSSKWTKLKFVTSFGTTLILLCCPLPGNTTYREHLEAVRNQQAAALADYLQGKSVKAENAWWLNSNFDNQPETIRLILQNNSENILPIIDYGRYKYIGRDGVKQWWIDEGRKKLLCDYTVKLKSEASPPVAEQAKQVSKQ